MFVLVGLVAMPQITRVRAGGQVYTFGAAGDFGTDADAVAVMQAVGTNKPDLFLALGDLSYTDPAVASEQSWCSMVKTNINTGAGLAISDPFGQTYPFQIVAGNHEMNLGTKNGLIDNFVMPDCLPNRLPITESPYLGTNPSASGNYAKEYYFDYPSASPTTRFIMTSPNLVFEHGGKYDYTVGSPRYEWLASAIDSARASGVKWIVVSNHYNYITTGKKTNEAGSDFFNLLVEKKVDLILEGHDHTYQRSKQLSLSNDCPTIATGTADTDCIVNYDQNQGQSNEFTKGEGPILVISGVGGKGYVMTNQLTDGEGPYFNTVMGNTSSLRASGYITFTVDNDTMSGQFVRARGGTAFSDAFTITEATDPDTTPPSTPSSVSAVANDARSATISWSASTDDQELSHYRVVRDGTIVANTVFDTSFTDNSLSPSATYSYKIVAIDGAGNESTESDAVSVTTPESPSTYNETFDNASGSAWPSAWTTDTSNGVVNTDTSTGKLTFNDVTNAYGRAQLTTLPASSDSEVLLSYRFNETTPKAVLTITLKGSGGWANRFNPSNGYTITLTSDAAALVVKKVVNKNVVTTANYTKARTLNTAKQWLRARMVGSTLQIKTWADGTAEPSTWKIAWTDTSSPITDAGQLHVSWARAVSDNIGVHTVYIDDVTLENL